MNQEALTKARGVIVEKFVAIEWTVSLIISQRYLKKLDMEFLQDVLCDDAVNFGLRVNLLEKIEPKFEYMQELRKMNNIRNKFAHCHQMIIEIDDASGQGRRIAVNPKKQNIEINFESLENEFNNLFPKVNESLFQLLLCLGAQLTPQNEHTPIIE
jgi:uncharacterized protein YbaP (TraB family)